VFWARCDVRSRNKRFGKTKRDFGVERESEKMNGSGVAEFVDGNIDRRLKRE
jgi:hypothetical protein